MQTSYFANCLWSLNNGGPADTEETQQNAVGAQQQQERQQEQ